MIDLAMKQFLFRRDQREIQFLSHGILSFALWYRPPGRASTRHGRGELRRGFSR
jgi:hypothetical protein